MNKQNPNCLMAKVHRKGIAIGILISISTYLLYHDIVHLMNYYLAMTAQPLAVELSAGPVDVKITDATDWNTVAQAVVTILATYLGIKAINRVFK